MDIVHILKRAVHILKRAVLHPSVLHDTNAHTVDPSSGCV